MSLTRLALRIAAMATLRPPVAPTAPPRTAWPTLAEGRVLEGALDKFDPASLRDRGAWIGVSTTGSETEERADFNGLRPGFAWATLEFEIGIPAADDLGGGQMSIGFPATDAEIEANLDLLEHQIRMLILRSPLIAKVSPWGARKVSSVPYFTDDGSERLALRRIEMEMSIFDDLDEYGRPPQALADLIAALPAGCREREILEVVGELAATPMTGYRATEYIRLAFDLGPMTGTTTETEHVRADVALDPAAPPVVDPRNAPIAPEPEPEGPIDDTDPRVPFTAPQI
jgi:hypothetical protein